METLYLTYVQVQPVSPYRLPATIMAKSWGSILAIKCWKLASALSKREA